MHEFTIARNICRAAAEHTGGAEITFMRVEVGALAGVSVDALDFCLGEMAGEAGLGKPEIIVEEVPAALKCSCGKEYRTFELLEGCPSCGGFDREIISGMDITIKQIENEKERK